MESPLHEEELPIALIKEYEILCQIMEYHEHKSIWIPFIGKKLTCRMEPKKTFEKYAVAVIKNGSVIGHLMKRERGKFAKTIFLFLHLDELKLCTAVVTSKTVNKNDGLGMQIPCKLIFTKSKNFIEKLQKLI